MEWTYNRFFGSLSSFPISPEKGIDQVFHRIIILSIPIKEKSIYIYNTINYTYEIIYTDPDPIVGFWL